MWKEQLGKAKKFTLHHLINRQEIFKTQHNPKKHYKAKL
jgi:hypothetical protein